MPYNIADPDRDMDDLVVRKAQVFKEKQGIDLRTGHCVEKIDRQAKIISGHDQEQNIFELPYDKLLIATGGAPIVPNLPGFNLEGVMALKSLEHGRKIKAFIQSHQIKKAVIIGMGYIALEMCEALKSRGIQVSMVKPRPVFLPWMNPKLSDIVREEVSRNEVGLYLGHGVTEICRVGSDLLHVLCGDLNIECQMVLVAIGVTPNSALAAESGLILDQITPSLLKRTCGHPIAAFMRQGIVLMHIMW